jgi:hypothetical protein
MRRFFDRLFTLLLFFAGAIELLWYLLDDETQSDD